MKILNYSFVLQTKGFTDVVDITEKIIFLIGESGIEDGNAMVFSAGSTCGLTTIEFEPGVVDDFKEFFENIAPMKKEYKHNLRWGDGNGFAHIRAAFTKSSFSFPIISGKAILGTWQQIVFIDFDNNPRSRKVILQIIGS